MGEKMLKEMMYGRTGYLNVPSSTSLNCAIRDQFKPNVIELLSTPGYYALHTCTCRSTCSAFKDQKVDHYFIICGLNSIQKAASYRKLQKYTIRSRTLESICIEFIMNSMVIPTKVHGLPFEYPSHHTVKK